MTQVKGLDGRPCLQRTGPLAAILERRELLLVRVVQIGDRQRPPQQRPHRQQVGGQAR